MCARCSLGTGKHPVLLYVDKGKKFPSFTGWEKVTYEQTQTPIYQSYLQRFSNTGVLLGGADDLCALDCDTEFFVAELVQLNPCLASMLTSVGERGAQFWGYVTGMRPQKVEGLRVRKDSPLATGAKKVEADGTVKVGEFRSEGGQSIVGGDSSVRVPVQMVLLESAHHTALRLHQVTQRRHHPPGARTTERINRAWAVPPMIVSSSGAIAILSIDALWSQFGYPPRDGNPVCSPFREDRSPSFSVYDEGRRFKDHGNGDRGDSFDFYQRAKGQDAKTAARRRVLRFIG